MVYVMVSSPLVTKAVLMCSMNHNTWQGVNLFGTTGSRFDLAYGDIPEDFAKRVMRTRNTAEEASQ